jgi:hypothetical protein
MDGAIFISQIGETEIDDNIYDYSEMKYSDMIKEFEKSYGKKCKSSGICHDPDIKCSLLTILYEDDHAIEYKIKM